MDTITIVVHFKYKENESWDGRELLRKDGELLWAGHEIMQLIGLDEPDWDEVVVAEYPDEKIYNEVLQRLKDDTTLEYYKVFLVSHYPMGQMDKVNQMIVDFEEDDTDTSLALISYDDYFETSKKSGTAHIESTPDQIRALLERDPKKPVIMLNYIRYHDKAIFPDGFEGKKPESGKMAYREYGKIIMKHHGQQQGHMDVAGKVIKAVVAENEPEWTSYMFIRYASCHKFVATTQVKEIMGGDGALYRKAGLAETIILAVTPYDEPQKSAGQ